MTSCQHIQQRGTVYRPLAGAPMRLHAALAWHTDNASAALRTVLGIAEEALPTPEEVDRPARSGAQLDKGYPAGAE
ncbi:hypothetical protein [Saccharopolyspora sp. ASAGF58]|uniref:hypothetical protein n=1 Tax=Saccharopolyspora sp. ASAGF58 TaxID=2719023 RepID=UPI0035304A64